MKKLRKQLAEWQQRELPHTTKAQCAVGLVEEVGELAHALLKRAQGIRGMDDEKFLHDAQDALADIAIFSLNLQNCPMDKGGGGTHLLRLLEPILRQVHSIVYVLSHEVEPAEMAHEHLQDKLTRFSAAMGWDYQRLVEDTAREVMKRRWATAVQIPEQEEPIVNKDVKDITQRGLLESAAWALEIILKPAEYDLTQDKATNMAIDTLEDLNTYLDKEVKPK